SALSVFSCLASTDIYTLSLHDALPIFIIQIILARLLAPADFGLIGMILVFVALSNSLVDSGFTQALIRDQKANQTDYSTVFYFRSEEHTSELQSRENLVCRLLLEKKKK